MSTEAWTHLIVSVVATVVWLAAYRLPFAAARTRKRFRLAVSSATGLSPTLVFPILGTAIYLGLAIGAIVTVMLVSGPTLDDLVGPAPSLMIGALTLLAILGASAATAFGMSLLYSVNPRVDVPAAVSSVGWIREVMVLPVRWRWLVPMSSAAAEEFFFRGVVLVGLLSADVAPWIAIGSAGLLFTIGQVVLTENPVQSIVLAISSVVLSIVGGLLVVVTGSVIPAIVVHAAFAGYYTNSTSPSSRSATVR